MLLAGFALPASAYAQCVTDRFAVDACLGGVRINGPSLPPGVTLDLNFMTPGTLDPRITFTRASGAAYIDASGVIQTAAVNAPRWDYAGGSLRGLLIEEARTNIALNSGDASNTGSLVDWQNGASNGVVTITGNQTTAPDGTTRGARVFYNATYPAATDFANVFFTKTVTVNPYSFSVYMKGTVGGEQLYLMATSDGVLYYRTLCTLTTAWRRFTLTTLNLTAATWYFQIGVDRRDASQTAKPIQTVFMWGSQIEPGSAATSYIPTTSAAVTRATDQCLIPSASMSPWFASPGGSWFAEFDFFNPAPNNARVLSRGNTAGSNTPLFLFTSPLSASQYDGVGFFNTANVVVPNTVTKMASTWAPGTAKLCANGGAIATSGALSGGYSVLATDGVSIFTPQSTPSTDNTSGHIRRVQYWPRVLSDAEMQQVTT